MLALTDAPDSRLEDVLGGGLADYIEQQTGVRDGRPLAVELRDPDTGAPIGGILGRTTLGLFFLDLFYLPERLRRSGIGSQALRMAEAEAIRRGCLSAVLITMNIMAPEFYARHGWQEFGRIATVPGAERIFMRKTLAA
jgi:GNAT superfamily N-acetyltransferase